MCKGCYWESTIIAIENLRKSGMAKTADDFLLTSLRRIESNRHVSPTLKNTLAIVEKNAGYKGVGDVQKNRSDVRRKGSGIFS